MEEAKIELVLMTQRLRGGGGENEGGGGEDVGSELWMGEFLRVPELMTVAGSADGAWRALVNLGEKFFADVRVGELWQRAITGGAGEAAVETIAVAVELEPGKLQRGVGNGGVWRDPVEVVFHGVRWKRSGTGAGGPSWIGYVPLVGAAAVAEKAGDLAEALEREIRLAIGRWQAERSMNSGGGTDGAGLTLRSVALLQRVMEIRLEKTAVALRVLSPKAREQEASKGSAEKSTLEEAATVMAAQAMPRAYELGDVTEKIAEALTGKSARCVLLVGASGVGKTAAVRQLVRDRETLGLGDRTMWETSGSRLIMGAMGYGMWQERCHKFCREAQARRAIIYLGNLVELLEVGKSENNAIGIAGQLRGYMERGQLLAIAECTPEQVGVLEREDPHLLSAFRQFNVEEPAAEKARRILQQVAEELTSGEPRRRGKDLEILPVMTTAALDEIERLHRRYATYSAFPGRPIRFLRNLIKDAHGHGYLAGETIGAAHVTAAFARETGLPKMLLDETVSLEAEEARGWFGSRVIAQEGAVTGVVDLLATVKAAMNRPRRPIASLLFIGPTGVGKTEMAKALAEYFFSDRARLTRFDMSEYATPHGVARLVGGAGGGSEGVLTAKVRQQPFSVVLLDEVEKAHGSFFDLMLQVLGEGRLTDAGGRVADFSNAVVIMTSNLGAASFGKGGFGLGESRGKKDAGGAGAHFVEEVRAFLRPEMFNRIDRIVPFLPLDAAAIGLVAEREVQLVQGRDGLRLREVALELDPGAVRMLAAHGFDPAYGARPLKRAIEREMLAPLADALNAYAPGHALKAVIAAEKAGLSVRVRALDGVKESGGMVGPRIAEQASRLRRKLQQLEKSGTVLSVRNEVFQLERQINRILLKGELQHPQLQQLRDRLKRVKAPADEVDALLHETIAAEEAALLAFYERAEARDAGRNWLEDLGVMERRLEDVLLVLYALRYVNPDRVSIGVFGEKEARLFDLAQAYYAAADRRGFGARLAWYKHEARGLIRMLEDSAKGYVTKGAGKPLGIVLEITGAFAVPWFLGEAGWHAFKDKSGKLTYCEVATGACGLNDLETPEDVHRAGRKPVGGLRREIDIGNKTVGDPYLPGSDDWSDFAAMVDVMMHWHLQELIHVPIADADGGAAKGGR